VRAGLFFSPGQLTANQMPCLAPRFLLFNNYREYGGGMMEEEIGMVTHYFSKISVAVIEITAGSLKVGDTIHIKGHTSDFTQQVESLQQEHLSIPQAGKGSSVGLKVMQPVHDHDRVFKVKGGAY
jgi:translation initiation factor IF-2